MHRRREVDHGTDARIEPVGAEFRPGQAGFYVAAQPRPGRTGIDARRQGGGTGTSHVLGKHTINGTALNSRL